jgi:hypothetical protein
MPFVLGSDVKIAGLKARPDLNGMIGVVEEHNKETNRYNIRVRPPSGGASEVIALRPASLVLVSRAAAGKQPKRFDTEAGTIHEENRGIRVSNRAPDLPSSTAIVAQTEEFRMTLAEQQDVKTLLPLCRKHEECSERGVERWLPKVVSALTRNQQKTYTHPCEGLFQWMRRGDAGQGWQEFDARMAGMGLTVGQRTALKHLAEDYMKPPVTPLDKIIAEIKLKDTTMKITLPVRYHSKPLVQSIIEPFLRAYSEKVSGGVSQKLFTLEDVNYVEVNECKLPDDPRWDLEDRWCKSFTDLIAEKRVIHKADDKDRIECEMKIELLTAEEKEIIRKERLPRSPIASDDEDEFPEDVHPLALEDDIDISPEEEEAIADRERAEMERQYEMAELGPEEMARRDAAREAKIAKSMANYQEYHDREIQRIDPRPTQYQQEQAAKEEEEEIS